MRIKFPNLLRKIYATGSGHNHVGDDQGRFQVSDAGKRIRCIVRDAAFIAHSIENFAKRICNRPLVIDYQNSSCHGYGLFALTIPTAGLQTLSDLLVNQARTGSSCGRTFGHPTGTALTKLT